MFDGSNGVSPAQIAAKVRKPGRLQALEDELSGVKARRQEIAERTRILSGQPRGAVDQPSPDAELRALDREARDVAERAAAARRELVALHRKHGQAMAHAMQPVLRSAAARGHAAAEALREALDEIELATALVEEAHGQIFFIPSTDLRLLVERLARLAQ